jgi:glycosyltransferase involved in cell wall biosynthesis
MLAQACERGLSVFAGDAGPEEAVVSAGGLQVAQFRKAQNRHFRSASSPYYLLWQSGLVQWLEEWDPDVLVVEANPRYLSTRLAMRWMHGRGRPVIGWGLGVAQPGGRPQLNGGLSRLQGWWGGGLLQGCDGMIAYSHIGASEYRTFGFPADRVFVARNAVVGRPAFPPPDRPRKPAAELAVLFVGRLQARKRVDLLIQACSHLQPGQRPRLWIVGDGPMKEEWKRMAGEIYPQAEFFGTRRGEEIGRIFAAADLFVLPGTGGLAIQEAMSYALPVLVAGGDGTQDDLVSVENGWLVNADDPQVLAGTLGEALSDIERLRRMGQVSYRIVRDEVNLENMVRDFVAAIWAVTSEDKQREQR